MEVTLVLGAVHGLWGCFFQMSLIMNLSPTSQKKCTSEIIKLQKKPFLHTQLAALEENLSNHPRKVFSRPVSCSYLKGRDRAEVEFFNRSGV